MNSSTGSDTERDKQPSALQTTTWYACLYAYLSLSLSLSLSLCLSLSLSLSLSLWVGPFWVYASSLRVWKISARPFAYVIAAQ